MTGPNDLLLKILFKVQEVRLFDSGSQFKEQSQNHYPDSGDAQTFTFNKVSFQDKKDPSGRFRLCITSKLEILFTSPPLASFCLILKKMWWRLAHSATCDGLHWKCLAVKVCKEGNKADPWYFRAFKLLPNEIWHLLVWWRWEMPIFKQLCLYFAESYSVVIHPHCRFLAIMPLIRPFCSSVHQFS